MTNRERTSLDNWLTREPDWRDPQPNPHCGDCQGIGEKEDGSDCECLGWDEDAYTEQRWIGGYAMDDDDIAEYMSHSDADSGL